MIRTIILLFVTCFYSCNHDGERSSSELKQSLDLVFQDEFEGEKLDTLKWNYFSPSPAPFDKILPRGNCDFENAAIIQKENVIIENGRLNLIAKHEMKSYTGKVDAVKGSDLGCNLLGGENFLFEQTFTSASIFSKKGYNHGYFECRAKIPCALGLYPVFWLWHHDEIVVFEFFGDSRNHFVSSHNKERYVTKKFSQMEYCADFHTYAVYWTPDTITWYVDEKQIWRICQYDKEAGKKCTPTSEPDNNEYTMQESFPDSTNRWLSPNISLRVYEWADEVDLTNIPDTLIIDYVRIYQHKRNQQN